MRSQVLQWLTTCIQWAYGVTYGNIPDESLLSIRAPWRSWFDSCCVQITLLLFFLSYVGGGGESRLRWSFPLL